MSQWDTIIVGAGIVGLAVAYELMARRPEDRLLVVDREVSVAAHQTGHNSGVIHSGLYYRPQSLKARLTRLGRALLVNFLDQEHLAYKISGKLVVARRVEELYALEQLFQNGVANRVPQIALWPGDRLREIEPSVLGIRAIYSPTTGVVDYSAVARRMAERLQKAGHCLCLGHGVRHVVVDAGLVRMRLDNGEELSAPHAIVAAGIGTDRLARQARLALNARMIPFRGDYLVVAENRRDLVRSMIYPVPNPRLPFLGVHFTRRLDGALWIGPNAVLAASRTIYRRIALSRHDLWDTISFPGFWRMARQQWRAGLDEWMRDHCKRLYLSQVREYVPELAPMDVHWGPMGIRAQLVDASGTLVDDFRLATLGPVMFVLNAPSPAATSAFAIARYLVESCAPNFGWKLSRPLLTP
ncbi:MAG: L-2-hydroxyglutarate oxidase [Sulfobacillus acidophilus]|uniref:L-2-hydroxyglutarate oxidase n=1 Tax=Sulfobacillus acidophilus TaxID=53633 RepID=A0A2T2WE34_9FIRM|nr:MAG: L-2-hydroxyglutarate oxidase [Sulfobacillus acidophilus]